MPVSSSSSRQTATLQELALALFRGKATDRLVEGASALRNLSSTLSRSDAFMNVAKGRWGLAEWYPNRVRKTRKGKDEPAGVEGTNEAPGE